MDNILDYCGLTDAYFKRLVHDRKEVLVKLLKGICNIEVDNEDEIEFENVENIDELSLKTTRFDISIRILNTRIDIESENSREGDIKYYYNRKIYYLSRLHSSIYKDTISYNEEHRSFVVFIYNFDIGNNYLISESYLYNKEKDYIYPHLRIYDVCLPRINKSSTLEVERLLDLLRSNDITSYKNSENEFLKDVAKMITIYDKDEIMRLQVEQNRDAVRQLNSIKEYAKNQGIEEGKKETAKNMLSKGMDVVLISECTGLSIEEIKQIK